MQLAPAEIRDAKHLEMHGMVPIMMNYPVQNATCAPVEKYCLRFPVT